jgi:hypothetical protein
MEHRGKGYVAAMLFDDPVFCRRNDEKNYGRTIGCERIVVAAGCRPPQRKRGDLIRFLFSAPFGVRPRPL